MAASAHEGPPKRPAKLTLADFGLGLGVLASILTVALVLIWLSGGMPATLEFAWAWVVAVGLWIYVSLLI